MIIKCNGEAGYSFNGVMTIVIILIVITIMIITIITITTIIIYKQ
jgi:heme/copper-type cytochrome/quinol oxidase subunit 2